MIFRTEFSLTFLNELITNRSQEYKWCKDHERNILIVGFISLLFIIFSSVCVITLFALLISFFMSIFVNKNLLFLLLGELLILSPYNVCSDYELESLRVWHSCYNRLQTLQCITFNIVTLINSTQCSWTRCTNDQHVVKPGISRATGKFVPQMARCDSHRNTWDMSRVTFAKFCAAMRRETSSRIERTTRLNIAEISDARSFRRPVF